MRERCAGRRDDVEPFTGATVSRCSLWLREISAICRKSFPQYSFPTWRMPSFLMYIVAMFDPRISFNYLRLHLGKQRQGAWRCVRCVALLAESSSAVRAVNGERIRTTLGLRYRDIEQTLIDSCIALIELGIVPDKRSQGRAAATAGAAGAAAAVGAAEAAEVTDTAAAGAPDESAPLVAAAPGATEAGAGAGAGADLAGRNTEEAAYAVVQPRSRASELRR